MADLSPRPTASVEFLPADYALAYSALARRVSAAAVFLFHNDPLGAKGELEGAMKVIQQVENTTVILKSNDH